MSKTGFEIDNGTLEAWAEITMGVWFQRQSLLGFSSEDGHLMDSMPDKALIEKKHNGEAASISFDFLMYGRFADMGVGRGFSKGNSGNVDYVRKRREPAEWFYRNWYREVKRLKEIMAKKYKDMAVNEINKSVDLFFGTKFCQTGKGANYSDNQRIRNAKNYKKRRELSGRWKNSKGVPRVWKPWSGQELRAMGLV